ncbi:hypothetical protein ACFO0S_09505 [Chryseomicrobium palamuruense]|uniref:Flagellar protein FliT n=1 Tax=Chryseomicrobium palamuruense TaxID=682973 RepID=A0ABV8UVC7_9BACL
MTTLTLDPIIELTQTINAHCDDMKSHLTDENFLGAIEFLQSLLDKRQVMIDNLESRDMNQFSKDQKEQLLQLDISASKKINALFTATAEKMSNLRSQQRASEGYKVNANEQGSFFDARN